MSDNKKMTDQEIDDLVTKAMDEVMAAITPGLEAKYDKYNEKKAKDKAEKVEAESELKDEDEG